MEREIGESNPETTEPAATMGGVNRGARGVSLKLSELDHFVSGERFTSKLAFTSLPGIDAE